MPEGLPDQLLTNYKTFFWDSSTGLYLGAALFVLGFTTFVITGFVTLCQRTCGGKSSNKKLSNNPRTSIDNPLYVMKREGATSRQELVEAEIGFEDDHQIIGTSESEEVNEEPTVIYENEQFFHAAAQSKMTEDGKHSDEERKRRPKDVYSTVIKPGKKYVK